MFQIQSFRQQGSLDVPLDVPLNAEIFVWTKAGDYAGVNFLEVNTVCADGPDIAKALGASVSSADLAKCQAACVAGCQKYSSLPQCTVFDDNDIVFDGAGSVAFSEHNHLITNDGDWGGWDANGNNKITIHANRHGSAGVAFWFTDTLGPSNMVGNKVDSAEMPEKLNFAVSGNLTMNVGSILFTCPHVRFAQGHTGSSNNWWFGGRNCIKSGGSAGDPITCTCNDGASLIVKSTNSSYHFSVSLANEQIIIGMMI